MAQMHVDDATRQAVLRVLESGRWIHGPEGEAFEREFARMLGARHAVVCANGTVALYMALWALGIRPGDEVVVPSFSFVATATPVVAHGAKPVFVDVRPDTYTLDVMQVERAITAKTRAIVPVDLYGHPVPEIKRLQEIADERNIPVLEDACQAHGATLNGQACGTFGKLSAFSFYPSKNMTVAGDGGALATNDDDLATKLRMLRDAGRRPGAKYDHDVVGLNFRLSEMQSAVGRVQLAKLPEWNEARRRNAAELTKRLTGTPGITLPIESPGARHVYHQYVIRVDGPDGSARDALAAHLRERGVETIIHYPVPIHEQPWARAAYGELALPNSSRAAREVLSLPVHPKLTPEDVALVAEGVTSFRRR